MKLYKKILLATVSVLLISSTLTTNISASISTVSQDVSINRKLQYKTSSADIPMFSLSTYYRLQSDNSETTRNLLGVDITYKNQNKYRLNKVYTAYFNGYHDHNYYGSDRVSVPTTWDSQAMKFRLPNTINSIHDQPMETHGYGMATAPTQKTLAENRPKNLFTKNICDTQTNINSINQNNNFNILEPACAPLDSEVLSFTLFDKDQNIQLNENNIFIDTEKLPIYGGHPGVWYGFMVGAFLHIDYDYDIRVVLTNPQDQKVDIGTTALFETELEIIGDSNNGLLFWEYSTDEGSTYTRISDENDTTLTIPQSNTYPDGTLFRSGYHPQSDDTVDLVYSEPARLSFNQNTVTFYTNQESITLDPLTLYTGQHLAFLPTLSHPGFTFEGWFKDPEFNEAISMVHAIASNIDLYAQWTKRELRTLTVHAQDIHGNPIDDFDIIIYDTANNQNIIFEGTPTQAFELYQDTTYQIEITRVTEPYIINPETLIRQIPIGTENLDLVYILEISDSQPGIETPEPEEPQPGIETPEPEEPQPGIETPEPGIETPLPEPEVETPLPDPGEVQKPEPFPESSKPDLNITQPDENVSVSSPISLGDKPTSKTLPKTGVELPNTILGGSYCILMGSLCLLLRTIRKKNT